MRKVTVSRICEGYAQTVLTFRITYVLRRRIEMKTEDILEEDEFQFRRGKESRDAIGMLGIISERTVDVDEELCVYYI